MRFDPFDREQWLLWDSAQEVQVEIREELSEEELAYAVWLADRLRPAIPPFIRLRSVDPQSPLAEHGPACPVCSRAVSRVEALIACTACLTVYHRTCLDHSQGGSAPLSPPSATCRHPDCRAEARDRLRA